MSGAVEERRRTRLAKRSADQKAGATRKKLRAERRFAIAMVSDRAGAGKRFSASPVAEVAEHAPVYRRWRLSRFPGGGTIW